MAVVKANAYGHGAVPIARTLQNAGDTRHFGVACLSEAQELRQVGLRGDLYTLGAFLPREADALLQSDVIPFVSSVEQMDALQAAGLRAPFPARCVLTVDTGMGREGLLPGDALALWIRAKEWTKGVRIVGISTHFSCADEPPEVCTEETGGQTECFARFVRELLELEGGTFAPLDDGRDNHGLLLSVCNSPGMLRADLPADLMPDGVNGLRGALMRPGLLLYGIAPFRGALDNAPYALRPALSWRARITLSRDLSCGATVGYGKTHTLSRPSKIATVAAGYADGVPRRLGNRGHVLLANGQAAPLVGRVSMDQCQIDITDCDQNAATVGSVVTFIGQSETGNAKQTVLDIAELAETTPHEPTCLLSRRVPRLYHA